MSQGTGRATITGERKQWHKVTLDFEGPERGEDEGTFLDHRLDVTFRHSGTGHEITVPGYFAADGDAGQTGADSGSVWRAHFSPPETGTWTWAASFRQGDGVAVAANAKAGSSAGAFDGAGGSISVAPSDKDGADLRGRGLLEHDGDRYLSFAGDGGTFLKSGVGSPENFLAYGGFDNTPGSHDYRPHERHFEAGDPSWGAGEGRGIIGAVNYLADHGVNSAYMLLMNVGGDGRDVWPWADGALDRIAKNAGNAPNSFDLTVDARAFDASKLDQWEIVFSHMEERGIVLHLFLQETENDHLLNDGDMGVERMLFMREMVARFAHHNGVIWNLGEETTNSAGELRAHSAHLKALDPYDHPVALHTYPSQHDRYEAHEGEPTLDVLSFQTNAADGLPDLDHYLGGAEKAGRAVVAFLDEPGNAGVGMAAEGDTGWRANHDALRETLWRSYTEGASGAEWYFGYRTAGGTGGDLAVEDFSTRESAYGWAAAARAFFEPLPLGEMGEGDHLTSGTTGADHVLADPGEVYAIYLPDGGTATLDLSGHGGRFDVAWYDPLSGGGFADGTVTTVAGGSEVSIGRAPYEAGREWAVLVRAEDGPAPKPAPKPTVELVSDDASNGGNSKGDPVYRMKDGLVVMQAEDGEFLRPNASGNDTWTLKTDMKGHKGDGYLLFDTQKDYFSARLAGTDPTGPMTYTFRVSGDEDDVAGRYFITLRATKPDTGEPSDRNNDFYVAAGPADEDPGAWKKVFFSGGAERWLWGSTFDVNHKKSPATFEVDGPGDYTIYVSGRSRQAGLDEIHVQKGSKNLDHSAPTSPLVPGGSRPDPEPTPKPEPKPEPEPQPKPKPKPEPRPEPADGETVLAIDLGASRAFTAADGTVFAADRTGVGRDGGTSSAIAGTRDDALYQTESWDRGGVAYSFDVEDGTYAVRMHFAETHAPNFKVGAKTFDVSVEGVVPAALKGLDVFARAGANTAYVAEHVVTVTDGSLDVEALKMAAIEVVRVGDATGPKPPAPSGGDAIAIDVGSRSAFTAKDGTVFAVDDTGVGRTSRTSAPIEGTLDDALYRTGVWDADGLSYDLALEDGTYAVTLHFAELWSGAFARGARVFDVALEGARVEDDLDVFAAVGARSALAVRHEVSVTDGSLDIDLLKGVQNPMLSGIEVERVGAASGSGSGSGSGGADAGSGGGSGSGSGAGGGAAPVARADAFVFDWARDVRVDEGTGMASVRLSAKDLLANDAGGEQIAVERSTSEGVLGLAGEGSDITFVFDPARFDGRDAFTYRALGQGDAVSAPATATIAVRGVPEPEAPTAVLTLVDARTDEMLFDLGASTVIDASSVAGRDLSMAARTEVSGVASARMLLDGATEAVENVAPYALFGDRSGDFAGGLTLRDGDRATLAAELYGAAGARGASLGGAAADVVVDDGRIQQGLWHAPDVFAFDETRMGADTVRGFEAFDQLAFFGGTVTAREVLARATVRDGDTVIDFGGGDVLTLDGFTGLGADHILG